MAILCGNKAAPTSHTMFVDHCLENESPNQSSSNTSVRGTDIFISFVQMPILCIIVHFLKKMRDYVVNKLFNPRNDAPKRFIV